MRILAEAMEAASATRGRKEKVRLLGGALRAAAELGGQAAIVLALRVLSGTLADGVGWAAVGAAVSQVVHASPGELWGRTRALGDLGSAAGALLADRGGGGEGVGLLELATLSHALLRATSAEERSARIAELLSRATPVEAKYLVRALLGEVLRG